MRKFNFRISRKGFAFSFAALFFVFLIFGIGALFLSQNEFTKDVAFVDARVNFIANEVEYFKESYIKSAASYSLYNTVDSLIRFLNNTDQLDDISGDHGLLNSLILQGMTEGGFYGNSQPFLSDKTITWYVWNFNNSFKTTYAGDFDYEVLAINVYEENPYFLSMEVLGRYNVSTDDNISNWIFDDQFTIKVPVYDLIDPEFLIEDDLRVPVRPAEFFEGVSSWTFEILNRTIYNNYSSVYVEPAYDYTIGTSFLSRLTNYSVGSYTNVSGFWMFDHDESNFGVYDSALLSPLGKQYGNTLLFMNFDNNSAGTVYDNSSYSNNGTENGDVDCNVVSLRNFGCNFDGTGDFISIDNAFLDMSPFTNEVSVSAWINPRSYPGAGTLSRIFKYGTGANEIISLSINSDGNVVFEVGTHVGGTSFQHISDEVVNLNEWTHVVGSFDGNEGNSFIFINGEFDNLFSSGPLVSFVPSSADIGIGDDVASGEGFDGFIDEFNLYNKFVSGEELVDLYDRRSSWFIDYKDSLHGRGVEFDSENDYVLINGTNNSENPGVSFEVWFKPYGSDIHNKEYLFESRISPTASHVINLEGDFPNSIDLDIVGSRGLVTSLNYSAGDITLDEWHHVVVVYDYDNPLLSLGRVNLYFNGVLVNTSVVTTAAVNLSGNYTLGKDFDSSFNFFNGTIDEFKVYGRALSDIEVESNFFNYKSTAKGCCNYITLINPNFMGYNSSIYNRTFGYTSKQFYNYYNRDINNSNVSYVNVTGIVSPNFNEEYHNFNMDFCMAEAFNIFFYGPPNQANPPVIRQPETATCRELVAQGVY